MISVRFQGKPFNIAVIQGYAPTSNAEEAEVEWFYEDLQDLLELTFQIPMQYSSLQHWTFYHQSHPQLGIVFALAPSHCFWSYFSTDLQ